MENLNKYQDILSKLDSLRNVTPSAEFRSRFEKLLIPALLSKAARVPLFGYVFRLAILIIAITVFSSTGIVLAAEQSKPGSLLYPIKQVVKNAKLALTSNQTAKALLHLEKGEDKIEELKQAAEDENNMNANRIVGDYEHDVNNALKETQNLNQKNIETAKTIDQTLEKHTQTLEQVKDQVPSPAQAAINKAITVSEKGQQQAQEVIQNNPSGNTLPTAIPVTNTPQSGQNHVDNPGSSNSQEQNIPSIQLPTQPQNNQNNNSDFGRNKANENKKK